MSDSGDDESGKPRLESGGGRTMVIDAVADADAVLEDNSASGDLDAPDDALAGPPIVSRAPPPLPKRGPKRSVVIAALVVVMALAVGAAFFASSMIAPVVAPTAAAPNSAAPTAATPASPPAAEAPAHRPITIEEIEITGGSDEDAGAGAE
jgi:hypothetical protein